MKKRSILKTKIVAAQKKIIPVFILQLLLLTAIVSPGLGQYVLENYANHDSSIQRLVSSSSHFKIVYPQDLSKVAQKILLLGEQIYEEYKAILGRAPDDKITIYLKELHQLISAKHALNLNPSTPLWEPNIFLQKAAESHKWKYLLRYEIAYVFQQSIYSSKLGLLQSFLAQPSQTTWSAGLPAYLAVPYLTPFDVRWGADYWNVNKTSNNSAKWPDDLTNTMLGRSQINYFTRPYSLNFLQAIYDKRQTFLGQTYFNFRSAFLRSTGVPYLFFYMQWKKDQFKRYNDSNFKSRFLDFVESKKDSLASIPKDIKKEKASNLVPPNDRYYSFLNINIEPPIVLPYYLNTDDFGLGGLINWQSPLRLHQFLFAGILSIPSVQDKSFFYTSYVNNTLGPRLELSYKHYSSASGFLDLNLKTLDAAALSSLWKIDAFSRDYSNWYAGIMIRRLSINYFSAAVLEEKESNIVFDNTLGQQTDLRLSLAWRLLPPSPNNIIHPLDGHGIRLSVTGSGSYLNPKAQYVRIYSESFLLLPAFGKQRIYLYGTGAIDLGEPIGGDYLAFAESGNYGLPQPRLMGSASPGVEGFIRGYRSSTVGERFLMGTVEYRIPLILDSDQYLLGFIPPARTTLALFTDVGILGGARTGDRNGFNEYRYSAGAEIKRVLGFEEFKITYKVGVAQALNRSFKPKLYFTVQSAIPF